MVPEMYVAFQQSKATIIAEITEGVEIFESTCGRHALLELVDDWGRILATPVALQMYVSNSQVLLNRMAGNTSRISVSPRRGKAVRPCGGRGVGARGQPFLHDGLP